MEGYRGLLRTAGSTKTAPHADWQRAALSTSSFEPARRPACGSRCPDHSSIGRRVGLLGVELCDPDVGVGKAWAFRCRSWTLPTPQRTGDSRSDEGDDVLNRSKWVVLS